MKNKFLVSVVIPCLVLALGALALAVGQTPTKLQKLPHPAPIAMADLQIKWVAASPCACDPDAAAVDAIILQGPVTVRVYNAGPLAADAEVTVAAMLHRFGSVVPQFPQKVHLEKGQSQSVVFFQSYNAQHGLLVCRSKGIKADIKLTGGAALDPNLSNNTLTIHGCTPIVE